jgi:hypothetical protein
MVSARATMSADTVHLTLSAREGPAPGTWRYNLTDGADHRAAGGRVAGMTDYMDALRYAAGSSPLAIQIIGWITLNGLLPAANARDKSTDNWQHIILANELGEAAD